MQDYCQQRTVELQKSTQLRELIVYMLVRAETMTRAGKHTEREHTGLNITMTIAKADERKFYWLKILLRC